MTCSQPMTSVPRNRLHTSLRGPYGGGIVARGLLKVKASFLCAARSGKPTVSMWIGQPRRDKRVSVLPKLNTNRHASTAGDRSPLPPQCALFNRMSQRTCDVEANASLQVFAWMRYFLLCFSTHFFSLSQVFAKPCGSTTSEVASLFCASSASACSRE